MKRATDQILTVAQMRAAEEELIERGTGVDALMQIAGQGAADWVFRLAWPRPVTVLCGPGNNGGDGYLIAQSLRKRHLPVVVVAPLDPATEAATNARAAYEGEIRTREGPPQGAVLVDCLFGSGLTRPLDEDLFQLLTTLSGAHAQRVAVDLPSGIESDSGRSLNDDLPNYDLTIGLGAWKFAHWTMPASSMMGDRRLVSIGVEPVPGAARLLAKPVLKAPAATAHKYTRGLLVVVAGTMPGASVLACRAAMHGGAGYVKLAAEAAPAAPADLVVDSAALADPRVSAVLIGPGLGRSEASRGQLAEALARNLPAVLDADALALVSPPILAQRREPIVATPHEGELVTLAKTFGIASSGKRAVALELARESGLVVIAKGPDTMIASPDGRLAIACPGPSWLSAAGTGDVLAGLVASRLASGSPPFEAACEAVWLHGDAARRAGPTFSAGDLIGHIPAAYESCL